ncbi:MAG: glutamate formimidoyltransferase [Bacteroidia bacterium]|nr:MAG: glutamate formimidoyltransferase [Bacteroidia bacterium]
MKKEQLIECVPNFSEGRDENVIRQITAEIEGVDGVRLVDVDPGRTTNRTVVTMVGTPDEVCEAAFRAVRKAAELIDMSRHHGAHPRFGATDVCPLIPVANITMEETVEYARRLAERIGTELGIPIYCYENAAFTPERRNLASCRQGEYEALKDRVASLDWKPDFGPAEFTASVARSGATAVGARNFLIAYNVNLNTTSTRWANAVAFDIREKGRPAREGDPIVGKKKVGPDGQVVMIPGSLKACKAIGWFIEEFGIAQVSINLTDISVTPLHIAFEECAAKAQVRGLRATGSEIVGVVPLKAMLDAGRYFLAKQKRSGGVSDSELIKIAVKSMGLDELYPFEPRKRIIEYILEDAAQGKRLIDLSVKGFVEETASESPAPGGGSVSAAMGAMGVALGTMVANLSSHKPGWVDRWEMFAEWAERGKQYQDQLTQMVDEDTNAFNAIMDALGLPKKTDAEKAARKAALDAATRRAIEVPLRVMRLCYDSMEVMEAMAKDGNPNSVSDAGVGALAALAGVRGAFLNVKINAAGLECQEECASYIARGEEIVKLAVEKEKAILEIVDAKIGS